MQPLHVVPLHDSATPMPPAAPSLATSPYSPTGIAANAYNITWTTHQLAFLHASTGYTTRSTFLRAIFRNYFIGWPHLTLARAKHHFQKSIHTAKGHIHMIKKYICSTQLLSKNVDPDTCNPDPPASRNSRSQTCHVTVGVINMTTYKEFQNKITADLPGYYPIRSVKSTKYLFAIFDTNSNFIDAVPIKNRSTSELLQERLVIYILLVIFCQKLFFQKPT